MDVFGKEVIFPENVSFAALQILLKENRFVDTVYSVAYVT
jgi:hypothetical protein